MQSDATAAVNNISPILIANRHPFIQIVTLLLDGKPDLSGVWMHATTTGRGSAANRSRWYRRSGRR
jgi:hypothetical protein